MAPCDMIHIYHSMTVTVATFTAASAKTHVTQTCEPLNLKPLKLRLQELPL